MSQNPLAAHDLAVEDVRRNPSPAQLYEDAIRFDRRTTIAVNAFETERDYLNEFIGDEHSTGVALLASRELAANASVDFQASYYDRERGAWIASPDGRVVDLVRVDAGRAMLDLDGDGAADDDAAHVALGISDD